MDYLYPSRDEAPGEPIPASAVLDEVLSAFGGTSTKSAAKRRRNFSHDQEYLREKLNKHSTKELSWGGLTKLNQVFGEELVTAAMRSACLAEDVGAVYPYIKTICVGQEFL